MARVGIGNRVDMGSRKVAVAPGRTFYFSASGSDVTGDGSLANPYYSFAKFSSYGGGHVLPGDTFLFKRGDVFAFADLTKSTIAIAESGTLSRPIRVGAYGVGARPQLTCYTDLPAWNVAETWTNVSGNIWRMAFTRNDQRIRVWIDGVEMKKSNSATVTATQQVYWDYANSYLYVYSTSNPATAFTSMKSVPNVIQGAVYIVWAKHLQFRNLDFRGYSLNTFRIRGGKHILIEDCTIGYDSIHTGVSLYNDEGNACEYITIRNNDFDSNDTIDHGWQEKSTEDGINISDSRYVNIYGNKFKNWGHGGLTIWSPYAYNRLERVKIYNNVFTAPDISYGRAFGGDVAYPYNHGSNSVEFWGNFCDDLPTHVQWQIPNSIVRNNIINQIRGIYWRPTGFAANGIDIAGYSTPDVFGMKIYNNVIANCEGMGIRIGGNAGGYGNVHDNAFVNNIIYNCKGRNNYDNTQYTYYHLYVADDADVLNNVYRNNIMYHPEQTNIIYYGHDNADSYIKTVEGFNSCNGTEGDVISRNIGSDPLLTSGTDFHVLEGSPAIGSAYNVGFGLVDIGAWAYLEVPIAFTNPSVYSHKENRKTVGTLSAGVGCCYKLEGGVDDGAFKVDADSGALLFETAPNYESPIDIGGDNVYNIVARAMRNGVTQTQAIAVTVENVIE